MPLGFHAGLRLVWAVPRETVSETMLFALCSIIFDKWDRHMRHLLVTSLVFALVLTGCGPAGTATYGEARRGGGRDRGGQARSVEAMFHEEDTNGDGKLTLSEFSHEFRSRSGLSAQQVFVELDADGDGFVTIEEFGARRARR